MWDAIKKFLLYILRWLAVVGFTVLAMTMVYIFITETSGIFEKSEAQKVEEKLMHKGLYFSKQYLVKLSNGETHSVFKRKFNTLEQGDSYQPFFQALSWKDFWSITFITSLLFILFISLAYFFALEIFRKTKLFQKLENIRESIITSFLALFQKNEQTRERWKKGSFLVLIIALSIPYIFMTKNVVIKVMPVGKESVIADIQDSEVVKSRRYRVLSNTYTLTYTFKDENNESYLTKKDVSSYTYYKYANASNIPISYRKKFPYETFIDRQSVGEVISTLFRFSNFPLLLNAGLLIYIIKKFIGTWGMPFKRKK